MKLSVMQWNVWYKEDIENIAAFIKRHSPDVVCLQELTKNLGEQSHQDTVEYIAEELGYYHFASEPMTHTDVDWVQFNAIFSKYPLSNTRTALIKGHGSLVDYNSEPRSYVEAAIAVSSSVVHIGTAHLSYIDWYRETEPKKQEADRLIELIRDVPRLILAVDINDPPSNYTYREVSKILHNAGPELDQNTWTTKPYKHNDFEVNDLTWRLDHIFASPELKVLSSEALPTQYSDHLPVMALFDI